MLELHGISSHFHCSYCYPRQIIPRQTRPEFDWIAPDALFRSSYFCKLLKNGTLYHTYYISWEKLNKIVVEAVYDNYHTKNTLSQLFAAMLRDRHARAHSLGSLTALVTF